MPAIIRFLGYNPLPEATTLGRRLVPAPDDAGDDPEGGGGMNRRGSRHVGAGGEGAYQWSTRSRGEISWC